MALVIFSIIALSLAAFFAALTWRLTRQEELRSAARVAILSDAIDEATATAPSEDVPVQHEFLAHKRNASANRGLMFAGGGVVVVVLIILLAIAGTTRQSRSAAALVPGGSLELLSMRYEKNAETLTVTGLVRNGASTPAQRLTAVVFTFDRSGNFIASGRAPLDFVSLAPGDESPFRVSVPNVGDVGRYRVTFRTESGVVRHIDRRQALVADGAAVAREVAAPR
jgi:uncharacterized membrane protein